MKLTNINLSDVDSILLKGIEYTNSNRISSTINIFTNYGAIQTPIIYCDVNELIDEFGKHFITAIKDLYEEFELRDKREPGRVQIAPDMKKFLSKLTKENKLRIELFE